MTGSAVEQLEVHVGARRGGRSFEEVLNQLGLQTAYARASFRDVDHRVRAAAQVDGGDRERFVHRHQKITRAIDAAARAERRRHRLAECNAEIFDGVMLIDVEVAGGLDLEIESAMTRDQLQHVIEKADPGVNPVASSAVERQPQRDLRLSRAAADYGAAHSTSSITAMQRRVCSTIPAAMRMQPAQPGSVERSRM